MPGESRCSRVLFAMLRSVGCCLPGIYIYISISIGLLGPPYLGPRILSLHALTVSFHNFKSQNFKLSVSIPKSKYVAYVSVLSRISNCQGLGRKNKNDILKTDRICGLCVPMLLYHSFSVCFPNTPSPPTKSFPTKSP